MSIDKESTTVAVNIQRIMETPTKSVLSKTCMFCLSDTKRLYCMAYNKAFNEDFVSVVENVCDTKFLNANLEYLHVCESCIKICKKFFEFKTKYRPNVLESIQKSCRLKRASKNTPSPEKKNDPIFCPLGNPIKKFIKDPEIRVKRKLDFKDVIEHTYTKKTVSKMPEICDKPKKGVSSHRSIFEKSYLEKIAGDMKNLSKDGNSILFDRNAGQLSCRSWFSDLETEMESYCPELLDVLISAIGDKVSTTSKMATISTIYGMLLHCRNMKASAIQRVFTVLAIRYHADNKLLKILNEVHITLTDESKRTIMKEFADTSEEKIIREIGIGKDGKINGDNLDIYVTTNDIRMNNANKDYHFFASDWTADRVDLSNLDNTMPLSVEPVQNSLFIPSEDETSIYRNSLKVMLGRIMVEYMKGFHWMSSVIPDHIPHDLQETMAQKSSVHWIGVMLKNEASYSDCVQIMAEYESLITKWYTKAGRGGELDNLQVPVGGDQLTRVRLQGAKALREGSLTAQDRLEHMNPVIMEMFHTLQDFVEKLYSRFYKTNSGRDEGTLQHLKILLQRTNVNGNVKSRFKAHEDFILTVGYAYFLSYILKKFDMKDLDDEPKHPKLKKNVKMLHNNVKKVLFHTLMDETLDSLLEVYTDKQKRVALKVTVNEVVLNVTCQPDNGNLAFTVTMEGKKYLINVREGEAKIGKKVTIKTQSGLEVEMKIELLKTANEADDLHNYVKNFMQWFFLILNFKDTVKEGDINRNNVNLKMSIPFFYSHSALSKYFIECIDYILKTEALLTEKMALKVRCSSFVNIKGRKGKNKAADLQKENQILVLKDLIKGLGANKTEKAIVQVTKAGSVLYDVSENIRNILGIRDKKSTHKKRSVVDDVKFLISKLLQLDPWTERNGRSLNAFRSISGSPFTFDKLQFLASINQNVIRLSRGVYVMENEEDAVENEEDAVEN